MLNVMAPQLEAQLTRLTRGRGKNHIPSSVQGKERAVRGRLPIARGATKHWQVRIERKGGRERPISPSREEDMQVSNQKSEFLSEREREQRNI